MFKKLGVLILCALAFSSSSLLFASVALGAGRPWISIGVVPQIGEGDYVGGHIWFEREGEENYDDYAISMALEVARGDTRWAPKPTKNEPSVRIDADGKFSCRFVSGGNDAIAERLFVYLVPASFTPNGDANRTESAALDMVTIDRPKGGQIIVHQHGPVTWTPGK
jgi:hypothetical protein